MFILAMIVIIVGTAYYATLNAEENTAVIVSVISLLIAVPLVFFTCLYTTGNYHKQRRCHRTV